MRNYEYTYSDYLENAEALQDIFGPEEEGPEKCDNCGEYVNETINCESFMMCIECFTYYN